MIPSPPIVVCLDLALANTGFAVLSIGLTKDTLLHVETVHTEKSDKSVLRKAKIKVSDDEWRRTKELCVALNTVLKRYSPAHVFIECPTGGSKSANAAKCMAIARGAACAVLHAANQKVTLVTPFEAKRAATGNPTAKKQEVKLAARAEFSEFNGWIKGKRGQVLEGSNEHVYDAISVYMASKLTPTYKELKHDLIQQQASATDLST